MDNDLFRTLAQHADDGALTVLYSFPASTLPVRKAHINSIVSEVRGALKVAGVETDSAEARIQRFESEIRSERYRDAHGIAYFDGGTIQHAQPIDIDVDRLVTCASSFTIAPLIPLVESGPGFFVLALSRGEWRLVHSTSSGFKTLSVPNAPLSLEDANSQFEQPIDGGAQHAGTSNGNSPGAPRLHRQGFGHEAPDDAKDLRYVEALSRALAPVVQQSPVILIGLAPLSSTFRDHCGLHIAAVDVVDPQDLSGERLVGRAQEIMPTDNTVDRQFGVAKSTGQVVDDRRTLLQQASAGNIRVLVAPTDAQWVGEQSKRAAEAPRIGAVDAVTVAIGEVLAHGGDVFVGDSLAGIQRWPTSPVAK